MNGTAKTLYDAADLIELHGQSRSLTGCYCAGEAIEASSYSSQEMEMILEIFRTGGLSAMWDAAQTHFRDDSEERKAAEGSLQALLKVVSNSIGQK